MAGGHVSENSLYLKQVKWVVKIGYDLKYDNIIRVRVALNALM